MSVTWASILTGFLGFASGAFFMAAVLTGNMMSLWGAAGWAVLAVVCGWLAKETAHPPTVTDDMARAWDEGYEAGAEDQADIEGHRYTPENAGGYEFTQNPYRAAAALHGGGETNG